jgi:hypothetical protein
LRDANKAQLQDIAEMREGRSREVAELSRLGGAQAKSDKEMGEIRAQLAQEQMNDLREWEAMKREMTELREAQKREIAALRGEFTEGDSGLREKLAIVKEAQKILRQQLAESNGAQQRENAAHTDEIAGLRGQSETFAEKLGNLK